MRQKFFLLIILFLFIVLPARAGGSENDTKVEVSSTASIIDDNPNYQKPFEQQRDSKTAITPKNSLFWGIFDDFPRNLFWAIISGFIGLLLVIVTDWLKKPILYCEKRDETNSPPNHPLGNFKIIHIRVRNKDRKYKNLPMAINTAFSTQAKCALVDKSRKEEFAGKWDNTPQPFISGIVQPDMTFVPPKIDIYPSNGIDDEYQDLAIGIKYDGEDEFHLFNMESYLYLNAQLKNPKWKFGIGQYKGAIVLSSLGQKYHAEFTLYNNSSKLDDFYLKINKAK